MTNDNQRKAILATLSVIIFIILYPPFYSKNSHVFFNKGFAFIFSPPSHNSMVNIPLLLTMLLFTLIVGALFFIYLGKKNITKNQNDSNENQISDEIIYDKNKTKGFLYFLVIVMTILVPLFSILNTSSGFSNIERHFPELSNVQKWNLYKISIYASQILFSLLSIYGGLMLESKRTPEVIFQTKIILWTIYPIHYLISQLAIPIIIIGDIFTENIFNFHKFFITILVASLWTAYLTYSKQVKYLYFSTQQDDE